MGIGYRIKEARENQGLTQTELGKIVGVTGSAITNYENETSHPKEPVMYKLIEALKVDANYLFQDCVKLPKEVNDVTLAEYEHIKKYRFISTHSPDGASVVDTVLDREYAIADKISKQKKQLEQIQKMDMEVAEEIVPARVINYYYRLASAGTGQIIFDTPPTKRIEIPDIPEYRKADYAIGVNGNSMEPVFYDGDMLLIEMTEDIKVGDIGIFRVDNESYVKKLGETELISINPDAKNIPLNESARCMGKVIGKLPND
ncbi:S24 family peptidase [uncultured Bacteroides sp.]|uniref:XRE family transcriptional regulator n=1 Tax=uncultured Bacteroides sp. TaxID=162156 RepID=UPI002602CEDA|nr:S24 family peptidase [uncultured Bacteroides sp.]